MAGGRPTSYKPEYCQQVIDHCTTGKSIKSFASSIDVHIDTIYAWESAHPEFSEALRKARMNAETYWENLGVQNVTTRTPFNTDLYKFMGKVRFRWTEPQELKVETKDNKDEIIKNLQNQIASLLAVKNETL